MAIRVAVVDDHRVVRAGLVALLRQAPGLEVVGEAGSGEEALAVVAAARPDVVLMDIRMPGMDGVEATRQIRTRFPDVQVLVLTTYDDDELIWGGLQAGAKGYLLKDAPPQQLFEGIEAVARGQSLLPPEYRGQAGARHPPGRVHPARADRIPHRSGDRDPAAHRLWGREQGDRRRAGHQ